MKRNLFAALLLALPAYGQSVTFPEHDPRYRLRTSDVLEVHYRYTPEFDQTISVQPDGFVVMQLVGDIKVQGLTLDEAKSAILQKVSERLREPEVSLVLKDYEKPYFVIGGEVEHAGRFEMRGNVSALEAIAMAGGFKTASAKHSQVVLFRKVSPDSAKTQILNLKSAMTASASEPNIQLRPGDMLIVPQNRLSRIERIIKIVNIGAYVPL